MIRIVVSGARSWENPLPIREVMRRLSDIYYADQELLIITGGAPGVDTIVKREAEKLGVHVAEIDALWAAFNRSAGPRRNSVMLALEPRWLICFHWDLTESRGTRNCWEQAERQGIRRRLIQVPLHVAVPSTKAFADAKAEKKRSKGSRKRHR